MSNIKARHEATNACFEALKDLSEYDRECVIEAILNLFDGDGDGDDGTPIEKPKLRKVGS